MSRLQHFPRLHLLHRAVLAALLAALALGQAASASSPTAAGGQAARTLVVAPEGPYVTLAAALEAAQPGDIIEVRGGVHPGPVVVNMPDVTLEGVDWPVIDGGGEGTVVSLAAPGLTLRGFEVRGSGIEPDRNDGGITLLAEDQVVENNRLADVLVGIFVAQADRAIVRGNTITGKPEFDLGRKGDGIRLWYSREVLVESNHVYATRDVVAWYGEGLTLRGNVIENGRYSIHLMYCDGALIEDNTFDNNSVGVYTMYSRLVTIQHNLIRGQRGPSGYALGFKDADDIHIEGNVLVDNHAGVYLDSTPFSPDGVGIFTGNILAFNDIGIILLPAVSTNVFTANTFWENDQQVAVQGGGQLGSNDWTGNYWSDYAGYDAAGDGTGDTPYRAERVFEGLMGREPLLRVLLHSPTVQTIEAAGAAFPLIRPQPKLVDAAPRMTPAALPAWSVPPAPAGGQVAAAALGLLAVCAACWAWAQGAGRMTTGTVSAHPGQPLADTRAETVRVESVSKRYGRRLALRGVTFAAHGGEAVALWGANGAGKSTLLKAMLGLVQCQGEIAIGGQNVRRAGKAVRRLVGYVPQEMAFYDERVRATLTFYAQLKGVGAARVEELIDRLGLAGHAEAAVAALSGGLRQRLALAVALLADPPVLLLDEPTANLDAAAQQDYLRLLADLRSREGKTILFASHRLEEVEALADRVLLLEQGELVSILTPADLLARVLPEVELTLWVPADQRLAAVNALTGAGWSAHANGRGTVVVRVRAEHKAQPFQALQARGIAVDDFELARGGAWN